MLCGFVERTVHPREFFLEQVFEKLCSGPSEDAKSISAWAPESDLRSPRQPYTSWQSGKKSVPKRNY